MMVLLISESVSEAFARLGKADPTLDVHQFDAHEIPFDGPTGIITRVEQLLGESSTLKPYEKKQLMDQLVRIILRNA